MNKKVNTKEVKPIVVYTDGSCLPTNPGPGGYAIIVPVTETETITLNKGFHLTTNNRMELKALIEALKEFGPNKTFDVYLDSTYTMDGARFWMHGWHKKGWKRVDWKTQVEKPIKNLDLWQELYPLYKENKVWFHKVAAHTGDKYNEMADIAAKEAAKNPTEIDQGYADEVAKKVQ